MNVEIKSPTLHKDKVNQKKMVPLVLKLGFPDGSVVKNPPANAGDEGSILRLGRSSGEGLGNPLQCSCLENPHGQRSLAGYSLYIRKESDMTEATSHT